jgi:glycosyltransferase involved in cell wall biosynthesis
MRLTGDKIKVLHIITRFDKGGSAENTFQTVCGLDKGRYEVVLAAGAGVNETDEPIAKPGNSGFISAKETALQAVYKRDAESLATAENIAAVQASGARLIFVRHLARELNPFLDVAAFVSLCGIIRREKPDIVHTHTSKAGFLGRWAAWLCRVPAIIHTPHGHVFWGYFKSSKTRLFIVLERLTARITDRLVMLTPQEMKDHLRFRIAPEEKFTIIHSGVDLGRFDPMRFPPAKKAMDVKHFENDSRGHFTEKRYPEYVENTKFPNMSGMPLEENPGTFQISEVPEKKIVIGTVGRLTAIKGQDVLIRAFTELSETRDDIFLVLLGEGERRAELEELAIHLKVSENIRFLGWRPDVPEVIATFDIFCLPSLNEGMGKVIVEAMAMGLPVVASDIGGIKDLVQNGENGLLTPPGDAHALSEALALLCRDPERRRRMGTAGRLIAPLYSSEEMTKKIELLYESIGGKAALPHTT